MNRKGMVAMMDAMIFIVLISMLSITILTFDSEDETFEPLDASEICECVLSTDFTDSNLVPNMGDAEYRVADAVAYAVMTDSKAILNEVKLMVDELTMGNYDYSLKFTMNGVTRTIGDWNGFSESSYSGTWTVSGGKDLIVEMELG